MVKHYEAMRRAYFVEKLSIRALHRMLANDRETIRKAIGQAAPSACTLATVFARRSGLVLKAVKDRSSTLPYPQLEHYLSTIQIYPWCWSVFV